MSDLLQRQVHKNGMNRRASKQLKQVHLYLYSMAMLDSALRVRNSPTLAVF